jgi:predicted DNA-binding transcriptional regulator YafY
MDNDAKLRPLYLAKILYEQTDEDHYLTTVQLIKILEERYNIKSHRQTIKTDIEILKKFGMEIEEVKSTQNRYNVFGRKFDQAELKLLIDAVESSKFITQSNSDLLVDKIRTLTSQYRAEELTRNISVEGRIKTSNEKIYLIVEAINEAINQGKKITFECFKYNVKKEKKLKRDEPYKITPLHLVWNGDYYYMIGVYDYKNRLGTFRVDRINKIPVILKEDGIPAPEGFDLNQYMNTTFRMFDSEHEDVELICSNNLMDAIIDRFGTNITTYANDMESFRVIVNVAVSPVFYSWVFGFGGKMKIKGPIEVKEKYIEMLKAAM